MTDPSTRPPRGSPASAVSRRRLARRGRNGHSADCPYADRDDPDTCGICRSERIGAA